MGNIRFAVVGLVSLIVLLFVGGTTFAAIQVKIHANSGCTGPEVVSVIVGLAACAKATGLGTDHTHHIEVYTPEATLFAVSGSGTGNREVAFTPNVCGVWTAQVIEDDTNPPVVRATTTFTVTGCITTATLTVIKRVINDNGGTRLAADWTITVTGANATPGSFPGDENGTTVTLNANAPFSVSESGPGGYSQNSSGTCNSTGLSPGSNATCTLENNDIQPQLTVTKIVVNDNGGTALVGDFTLFVNGTPVNSGAATSFNSGVYTVSEAGPPGYSADSSGDCNNNGVVILEPGDNKNCTITNNDLAPELILQKVVVNDNGGTANPNDWTLNAIGPTPLSGPGPAVSSNLSFSAGTYTLSESGPSGYIGSLSCAGTILNGSQITLELGQSAICTFINDDQPSIGDERSSTLTIIKRTIGSDDVFRFTVVGATSSTHLVATAGGNGSITLILNAGRYSVHEDVLPSWTLIRADCDGQGTSFILGPGEHIQCTFTNQLLASGLVINEVGWPGTKADPMDQWLELHNPTPHDLKLDGWILKAVWVDEGELQQFVVRLQGMIPAFGFFLLEQADDDVISDILADQIYIGLLPQEGARLLLFDPYGQLADTANHEGGPWLAGSLENTASMERINPLAPDTKTNWITNNQVIRHGKDRRGNPINGTPRWSNSY